MFTVDESGKQDREPLPSNCVGDRLPNIMCYVLSPPGPNSVSQIDLTCFLLKFLSIYIWTITTASSQVSLSSISISLPFISSSTLKPNSVATSLIWALACLKTPAT